LLLLLLLTGAVEGGLDLGHGLHKGWSVFSGREGGNIAAQATLRLQQNLLGSLYKGT
jgi:hypothetical protein